MIFFLFLALIFSSDSLENGWKGIKPLESGRPEVEAILGKHQEINDSGYYYYDSNEVNLRVNYSSAPCKSTLYGRGDYNVAENTVRNYTVTIKKLVKLSDLKFNRENYVRGTEPHSSDSAFYSSKKDGIFIEVGVKDEIEYVSKITFTANEKNQEKYKCKTINIPGVAP